MNTTQFSQENQTHLNQLLEGFQENQTLLDQLLKIFQDKLDLQHTHQKELETEKERNKVLEEENKYLQGMLEDREIELSGLTYDCNHIGQKNKKKARSP